jgi:hypothetical protein
MGRVRGYVFTWLLSWFAFYALMVGDFAKRTAVGGAHAKELAGYIALTAFGALLSLPILFLLRVVPESSNSSGVRLVRRLVFGLLCGVVLGALLYESIAVVGKPDPGSETYLPTLGGLFGLIAGLVDSIALDDQAG